MSETPVQRIKKGLSAGYALFYVLCQEEARLENMLAEISATHYGDDRPLSLWSSSEGFHTRAGALDAITDPLQAVRHVASTQRDGFFLMKDLPVHFDSDPATVRALRDLDQRLAERDVHVFLAHPRLLLPESLKSQVFPVELGMPSEAEILDFLDRASRANCCPRRPRNGATCAHRR